MCSSPTPGVPLRLYRVRDAGVGTCGSGRRSAGRSVERRCAATVGAPRDRIVVGSAGHNPGAPGPHPAAGPAWATTPWSGGLRVLLDADDRLVAAGSAGFRRGRRPGGRADRVRCGPGCRRARRNASSCTGWHCRPSSPTTRTCSDSLRGPPCSGPRPGRATAPLLWPHPGSCGTALLGSGRDRRSHRDRPGIYPGPTLASIPACTAPIRPSASGLVSTPP